MSKKDLVNFYNAGFGWICKKCERELESLAPADDRKTSRLLREGEAESKETRFSNSALAKWTDKTQTALICPRCETTEAVNNQ